MASTFELLPDELLLDVCKYLLCIDVLQSFFGLNERMTRLIKGYRNHVSLHKGSYAQSNYIYTNIFPAIGADIRSLVIDRLYSVLQGEMFHRYFADQNLSNIFPRLEKLTLVSFRHETLLPFVHTFKGFERLVQVNLRGLFPIPPEHQPTVLAALFEINDQKITSVIISDNSSCLQLNILSNVSYSNITNLQITMAKLNDFLFLLSVIPNVTQLDVTLIDNTTFTFFNDDIPSLDHLIHFRLTSVNRSWFMDELVTFLRRIPAVQYLSLHIFSFDNRLIDGRQVRVLQEPLLQVRQFNYGVYHASETSSFDRQSVLATWPPFSIECLVDEKSDVNYIFAFIHTLSSYAKPFPSLELPGPIITKMMPLKQDDSQVECLTISKVSTVPGCLPIMAHWHRVKELTVWFSKPNPITTAVVEQQQHPMLIPKMARLKLLRLYGSVPSDLHHFSLILVAASNLIRLDLNFDTLLLLLDNEEANRLVQQRIRALSIGKGTSSSETVINIDHIPRIALAFPRLRHIFVDLTHLSPTIDSMILRILMEFDRRLVSLGADGPPSDEMKADAREWLEGNNNKSGLKILHPTNFDAYFNVESSRLLVWT